MAGYTRNDTLNNIADGNVISAADLDGEFNAIDAAFDEATGHVHDGTANNGAPITKVGPAQDLVVSTGAVTPKTDNAVDLGTSSFEFKDLHLDGVANIDSLVADTADINGGTIDGVTLGTNSAVTEAQIDNVNVNGNAITTTNANGNLALTPNGTGEVDISKVDIDSGTIDGTIIGGASAAAGTFTNLTASGTVNFTGATVSNGGTFTTIDINGGSIDAVTIGTNSAVTDMRVDNLQLNGNTISSTDTNGNIAITPNGTGEVDISKVDIDGGTIDGTVVGGATAAAGSFTTLATSGALTYGGVTLSNAVTGTGNMVLSTSPTLVTPVLGTPSSGTVTNLTGTASININGTVGATTPATGSFTTLNTSGQVVFNDAGADVDFRVEGDTDANLLFVDASTDKVGIGTNTPDALLSVDGIASFGAGSASTPSIAAAGDLNTGIFFSAADTLVVTTGGTAAVTVDAGQRTMFPTTIGVGGATPSTSGSGISFPATVSLSSNANTLDDYEEGTWTPVYKQTDGTVITTQTANVATFKYTKISNLVCLTYHYAQQTANMTNVRLITGLPFSCETGVGFWFSQFPYGTAQPSIAGWEAQINNGAVQVAFVANQTLATTNNWVFTVTYFTTV